MPQPERSDAWSGMGIGWTISSTLLGGILVWGGIGYLVDRLIGSDRIFTVAGFLLGAVGGIYVVYLRYGKEGRGGDGA